MTQSEIKTKIKEMKKFSKKLTSSKSNSKKFLVKAGICTEKGNLKQAYRQIFDLMYSSLPSFVLGFHGCDKKVGENVLSGKTTLHPSQNDYDWLGNGIYFWENNPERAYDFAREYRKRKGTLVINDPFAIGAVIDLGYCLNLLDSRFLGIVKEGYRLLQQTSEKSGVPLPKNKALLRHLDCAVIQAIHTYNKEEGKKEFTSVRAVFTEGKGLYENAGFHEKSHIQICVRNPNCIKGYFRIREHVKGFPIP